MFLYNWPEFPHEPISCIDEESGRGTEKDRKHFLTLPIMCNETVLVTWLLPGDLLSLGLKFLHRHTSLLLSLNSIPVQEGGPFIEESWIWLAPSSCLALTEL